MSLATIRRRQSERRLAQKLKAKRRTQSAVLNRYADDPISFVGQILGIEPTEQQRQILLSVRDRPITNVRAAHGVGKSLIAACIVLWWVFSVKGQCYTTAPTQGQVKEILWKEIRTLYDRHKSQLGGRRGELFVKLSEEAFAVGFTSRNYDSNSFQGKHAERLLLIQDEADGITETIDDGFRSCLTGSQNRGLRIGNPIDPSSPFAKSQETNPRQTFKIDAWSHPNVAWAYQLAQDEEGNSIHRLKPEIANLIGESEGKILPQDEWPDSEILQRDVIPGAISVAWIEEVRRDKEERSVFWMSRVEAEYPGDDVSGIVPISWLRRGRERYDSDPVYWDNLAMGYRWRLGCDVGDGGDSHAIARWKGPVLYQVETFATHGDELDVQRCADLLHDRLRWSEITARAIVDNTGVGAGVLAIVKKKGWSTSGCRFGATAENPERYVNRKTELLWQLRDLLRREEIAIAPLGSLEERVFEDLSSVRYTMDTKDRLVCEKKGKTRQRLGRSPDAGDAVIVGLETGLELDRSESPHEPVTPPLHQPHPAEKWFEV